MGAWRICYFEKTNAERPDMHHGAHSARNTLGHLGLSPQLGCDAK